MNNTTAARQAFPTALPVSPALFQKIQKLGCKTVQIYTTKIESIF